MAQSKSISQVFSYDSWIHAVSGATGGVIAMTVFYPFDTVRARLQLEDPIIQKYQNTFAILKYIIKNEGIYSIYRGLIPVLESLCISNFVYFYTFHSLKALTGSDPKNQNALKDLFLGALAGIVNVLSTTPFWVVNTRLKMKGVQGHSNDLNKNYNGLIEGLIYIAKTEGIKGLWSGAIPSLMLVINPALQFMMYELIKRKLQKSYGNLSALSFLGIGALAKAFSTIVTYPLQLVQTKLRHGGDRKNNANNHTNSIDKKNTSILDIFRKIIETQGFLGIYRGMEAKILQTVLTAALMFAIYEKIARNVSRILTRQPRVTI